MCARFPYSCTRLPFFQRRTVTAATLANYCVVRGSTAWCVSGRGLTTYRVAIPEDVSTTAFVSFRLRMLIGMPEVVYVRNPQREKRTARVHQRRVKSRRTRSRIVEHARKGTVTTTKTLGRAIAENIRSTSSASRMCKLVILVLRPIRYSGCLTWRAAHGRICSRITIVW